GAQSARARPRARTVRRAGDHARRRGRADRARRSGRAAHGGGANRARGRRRGRGGEPSRGRGAGRLPASGRGHAGRRGAAGHERAGPRRRALLACDARPGGRGAARSPPLAGGPEAPEPLDFHRFHREELPRRLAEGNGSLAASGAGRIGRLAFPLPAGDAYTYRPREGGIDVVPGDEAADTVIELEPEIWQNVVLELEAAAGLLYGGRGGGAPGAASPL